MIYTDEQHLWLDKRAEEIVKVMNGMIAHDIGHCEAIASSTITLAT